MSRKTLDPNLASILDSIRATVGGDTPLNPAPDADPDPEVEAKPARASRARPAQSAAAVPPPGKTVEEFLAELVRPQVDAWLKAHLPEIVQKMAAEEIRRLTGRT